MFRKISPEFWRAKKTMGRLWEGCFSMYSDPLSPNPTFVWLKTFLIYQYKIGCVCLSLTVYGTTIWHSLCHSVVTLQYHIRKLQNTFSILQLSAKTLTVPCDICRPVRKFKKCHSTTINKPHKTWMSWDGLVSAKQPFWATDTTDHMTCHLYGTTYVTC